MTNEELTIVYTIGTKKQRDRAFKELLRKNQGMINKALATMFKGHPQATRMIQQNRDEFQQVASLKLMDALDTYDILKGYRFITWYAYRLKAAINVFFQKSLHLVHKKAPDVISLNVVATDNGLEYIDLLETPETPDTCGSDEKYTDHLKAILKPQEREILSEYYSDLKPTLNDIGNKRGVTRERIRQIKDKSEKRIRKMFNQMLSSGDPVCIEISEIYKKEK